MNKPIAVNLSSIQAYEIPLRGTFDLSDQLIGPDGFQRVVPAKFFESTTINERALYGNLFGIYGFLTAELVQWLQDRLNGRTAIEIGAGDGSLSNALGIQATDSKMQEDPAVIAHYARIGAPVVKYGPNVRKISANDAVIAYRPKVVIGQWVTHLYKRERHEAGGNMWGVNEERIIRGCEEYIFIGNEQVHAGKSIWDLPHEIFYPDWLYSRASNGSRNFIACWKNQR